MSTRHVGEVPLITSSAHRYGWFMFPVWELLLLGGVSQDGYIPENYFTSENEVSKSLGKKQPITPQEKTNSAENLLLPVAKVSELKTCISNVECDCV